MECFGRGQAYTACMQQFKKRITNLSVAMTDLAHESNRRPGRGSRIKHRRPTLCRVPDLLFFLAGLLAYQPLLVSAQPRGFLSNTKSILASTARNGQHDFDFNVGVWHTHVRRILDPFSGSGGSIELNGTVTVRKVWGGRAQLEEIEADSPKG